MAPPATPDAKGLDPEGSPACGPPPGLGFPDVSPASTSSTAAEDQVEQIRKAVREHTDLQLQEKVEQIWQSAEDKLTAFDQQQDQARRPLEEELHLLRDKVDSLEADKMELRKTCLMMQDQLAVFASQLNAHHKLTGGQFGQMPMGGNVANAGMLGAFATLPTGFPTVPTFPVEQPPVRETVKAEQPNAFDPFSLLPPAILPTSAPGTPHLAPSASLPAQPVPPWPAGAEAGPPGLPAPGPPGLADAEESVLSQELSKFGALMNQLGADAAAGAEGPPGRAMAPKAKPAQNNVHSDALRMMREFKEKDPAGAAESSWPMQSPGARGGTPARKEPASPLPFHSPSSEAKRVGRASPLLASGLNQTPKRTPRLSFNRGTPGMKSPSISQSPFVICESGGTVFGFTLRRADDCVLGLDVEHSDVDKGLTVTSVKNGGAMSAWNKQCAGGPAAGKAVLPGDRIVKVNSATTPVDMLKECRESVLMKFTVVRGELDGDIDPLGVGNN